MAWTSCMGDDIMSSHPPESSHCSSARVTGTPVKYSWTIIPVMAIMASLPLFSSLFIMSRYSAGSSGRNRRGSKA